MKLEQVQRATELLNKEAKNVQQNVRNGASGPPANRRGNTDLRIRRTRESGSARP